MGDPGLEILANVSQEKVLLSNHIDERGEEQIPKDQIMGLNLVFIVESSSINNYPSTP
jgi:hypothetical protein